MITSVVLNYFVYIQFKNQSEINMVENNETRRGRYLGFSPNSETY